MKHARASKVEVVLRGCADGKFVSMTVSDDGRGFDSASVSLDRMGLKIIRERAQAIEAELTITSAPGKGSRVEVNWRASDEE
jgi:signal transduction histidine kinase